MEIMPILEDRVPSAIVFDHLAHIPQPDGVNHPLFARVGRGAAREGPAWVSSPAPTRHKSGPPIYADSSAVVGATPKAAWPDRSAACGAATRPSRPRQEGKQKELPDDACCSISRRLGARREAAPRILVENPAKLYDFGRS